MLLAATRVRPVQPLHVLFLPELNLAYLVTPKVGCSSLVESFVSAVEGDVDLPFPAAHEYLRNRAAALESKGLSSHFFSNRRTMRHFLSGKNLLVVSRPVLQRTLSAYRDYRGGVHGIAFPFFPRYSLRPHIPPRWTFDEFCRNLRMIDDNLADRHYRSQSFFWDAIPDSINLISSPLRGIETAFASNPVLSHIPRPKVRNRSATELEEPVTDDVMEALSQRYAGDLRAGIPLTSAD